MEINNNPLIDVYNIVEQIIKDNVQDINSIRRDLPTAREKQWIFPQTPEENLQYYPICSIILDNVSYSEFGAGRFRGYNVDTKSGYVSEINGNYAILSVTVGVFTKKKDRHEVTLPNKTQPSIVSGKLINMYLTGNIVNALQKNIDSFTDNGAESVAITNVTHTFSDNETLFASNISLRITMPMNWGVEYTTAELIQIINKNYKVEYKDQEVIL